MAQRGIQATGPGGVSKSPNLKFGYFDLQISESQIWIFGPPDLRNLDILTSKSPNLKFGYLDLQISESQIWIFGPPDLRISNLDILTSRSPNLKSGYLDLQIYEFQTWTFSAGETPPGVSAEVSGSVELAVVPAKRKEAPLTIGGKKCEKRVRRGEKGDNLPLDLGP